MIGSKVNPFSISTSFEIEWISYQGKCGYRYVFAIVCVRYNEKRRVGKQVISGLEANKIESQ